MGSIDDESRRLRLFRKEILKLTQKELAEETNTNQPLIHRYERGIQNISSDYVTTLYKKYGMNREWFYDGKGKPQLLKDAPKKTIVTDMASLANENLHLKARVDELENIVKKLYADFYERKYSGRKRLIPTDNSLTKN